MDDSRITELLFSRDGSALAALNEKYGAYCLKIAENVLRNRQDAEECVNDALLRVWRSVPPEKPASLMLYMARITRNIAFNRYNENTAEKRGGGECALVLDELAECVGGGGTEDEYFSKELGECIRGFVKGLPVRERNVFVRRYFYTESASEIAEKYGLTEENVRVILSRTRKKLKKLLIKEGFYNG